MADSPARANSSSCARCADLDALLVQRAQAIQELEERAVLKLAACDVAALSNTRETYAMAEIGRDHPAWSVAYSSVRNAVLREMEHRESAEAALTARTQALDHVTAEIRQWAIYCFQKHGHDAHLYNGLADLAGMHPEAADAARVSRAPHQEQP